MAKRFFVYPDRFSDAPVDPNGCDTLLEAQELALALYGPDNAADIRKEYINLLTQALV